MKLIVISDPEYLRNEAEAIDALFEAGLEYFHLRKPGSSEEDLSELIDAVDSQWHSKIILHDHYGLQERFSLKGIHLNRRNSSSARKGIPFSASCHSLAELDRLRPSVSGYLFLSPVFDSISKQGYHRAFSEGELSNAALSGTIDDRVVALGGISPANIPDLHQKGFGGIAVLGYLWNPYREDSDRDALVRRLKQLIKATAL